MTKWNRLYASLAAFFTAMLVPTAPLVGQTLTKYEIRSVSVSSGESAIISGLSIGIQLEPKSKSMLMDFTVQSEQAWLMVGPQWHKGEAKAVLTGDIGFLKGAPWTGLFATLDIPLDSVAGVPIAAGTTQWPAWFFLRKPDGRESDKSSIGYFGDVHASIGPLRISYSLNKFLDEPWNELPGVSYTVKARENLSISASATWNNNKERWMFWMGTSWTPDKHPG